MLDESVSEKEYAEILRNYDVLLTMWRSPHVPNELAQNPGKLRYICNITGEMTQWIDAPIIESPYITVTNWGNAPAFGIAEEICLRNLKHFENCEELEFVMTPQRYKLST